MNDVNKIMKQIAYDGGLLLGEQGEPPVMRNFDFLDLVNKKYRGDAYNNVIEWNQEHMRGYRIGQAKFLRTYPAMRSKDV